MAYLLAGLLGFAVTGFAAFASESDKELVVFGINPLHNIFHIALGAAWLGAAGTNRAARRVHVVLGAVLLAAAVLGFAGLFVDSWMNANPPDTVLHLATGGVALYLGRVRS